MKRIILSFLIVIMVSFIAESSDIIKIVVKAPTVKLPAEIKPKAPTNWSRIKDLFL